MRRKLIQWTTEPLVQFLLLGACIYGAYALVGAPDRGVDGSTIVITRERIDSLAEAWQQRWNRPPTDHELAGIIREYVREDVLYREALAMGLDKDDQVVRRRLAQKLEFLTSDVARMEEPTEDELKQYLQDNQQRFRTPDLITFTHVYFDRDKRGEATPDEAGAALARLQAAGIPDERALDEGDRFMLPRHYSQASELDISRNMGSDFAAAVMQLEPGQWHGPVPSGYGLHLVYVHEFLASPPPTFEEVRQQVLQEWRYTQTREFNEAFFESLKSRYDIVIEEPAPADDNERPAAALGGNATAASAGPAS